ncbi:MAG: helix-turn-helix transcriptional regulator [Ferruginibacter sp.]
MRTVKFKKKPSWLAELRKKRRMSQGQLAEYLGVSRSLVAHVEIGSRTLPIYAVERLIKLDKETRS